MIHINSSNTTINSRNSNELQMNRIELVVQFFINLSHWNTYTAKWSGDFLFHPLICTELTKYIAKTAEVWGKRIDRVSALLTTEKDSVTYRQQMHDEAQHTAEKCNFAESGSKLMVD